MSTGEFVLAQDGSVEYPSGLYYVDPPWSPNEAKIPGFEDAFLREILDRRLSVPFSPRYQLSESDMSPASVTAEAHLPSLFDIIANLIHKSGPSEVQAALSYLNPSHRRQAFPHFLCMSYSDLCSIRTNEDLEDQKIDEWILRNHQYMRNTSFDDPMAGLVRVLSGSEEDDKFFPNSTPIKQRIKRFYYRKLQRTTPPGFKLLGARRAESPHIQLSSNDFISTFDRLTDTLLRGLDWSNIFVAGGIVLATMLCPPDSNQAENIKAWVSSDVDIYIWGLSVREANAKILHIFDVFKTNLKFVRPHCEPFVLRNGRTITLIAEYPLRRFQIVLGLFKSPRDVLIGFDLDVCTMGFDGTNVWMMPRAVRALETGYNVMTMNQLHGPYLGSAQATRAPRMFKYAGRGFGINFIPFYLTQLEPNYLGDVMNDARQWVANFLRIQNRTTHCAMAREFRAADSKADEALDGIRVNDSARMVCLIAFQVLARHCALWEARYSASNSALQWNIDEWTYHEGEDENSNDYDATLYKYDESFSVDNLIATLKDRGPYNLYHRSPKGFPFRWVCVYGRSAEQVLQTPITNEILIPAPELIQHIRELIGAALRDAGLPVSDDLVLAASEEKPWITWNITSDTMWFRLDKRIDETHELLWMLRARIWQNLVRPTKLSQWATESLTPQDELGCFRLWAENSPLNKRNRWFFRS